MNMNYQTCNNCKTVNTNNDMTWIRVFGTTVGTSNFPIGGYRSRLPTNNPVPNNVLDFCPTCAGTLLINKIPTFIKS